MRRIRPRISLLTALLLMTIVAMAIVVALQWREIDPLRAEVRRLRQELGYLSVIDESKIYAIQVPGTDPDIHRFRVFLPNGRKFNYYSRVYRLPGRPARLSKKDWVAKLVEWGSGSSGSLESGEFTVDLQLRRDPDKKDHWLLEHRIPGKGSGVSGTLMPWLNDRRAWSVGGELSYNKQQEFSPDDGVILFKVRQGVVNEFKGGYSTTGADDTKETAGVMFFIAPADIGQ